MPNNSAPFTVSAGNDHVINGDAGHDEIEISAGEGVTVNGGDGKDKITISGGEGVVVNGEGWNDEVIILGDFSLGKADQTNAVLEQLNGILCLVEGNHDQFGRKKGYNAARFKWIRPYTELNDNKRKVVLCHYPILCYNGQYLRTEDGEPRTYMLYGHVHDTWDQRLMEQAQALSRQQERRRPDGTKYNLPCRMINCFCMYSDYTPLTLDEWIINDRERSALKN